MVRKNPRRKVRTVTHLSSVLISLGVFGVPLELLTERDGVETVLGVSHNTVRIPSVLDDIFSAMKQMGKHFSLGLLI